MSLAALLRDYALFNLWANLRIAEWLQTKEQDLLTRDVPSSFPSLRATLQHIWGAQDIWLRRLQGESLGGFTTTGFSGDNAELLARLLENSAAFANFVGDSPDDFFVESTTYRHFSGITYTQVNSEILLHCLQHSTFHRGQIVTMARNLGLTDPPATDYIAYVRLR